MITLPYKEFDITDKIEIVHQELLKESELYRYAVENKLAFLVCKLQLNHVEKQIEKNKAMEKRNMTTSTMLVAGVEHICLHYDDDNGRGLTLCEERIGPQDIGPRMDEPITCPKCREIAHLDAGKGDGALVVARHHKEDVDSATKLIDMATESITYRDHGQAIHLLKSAIEHLTKAEIYQKLLEEIGKEQKKPNS